MLSFVDIYSYLPLTWYVMKNVYIVFMFSHPQH